MDDLYFPDTDKIEKEDINLAIAIYEKQVEGGFDGSNPYRRLSIIYRKRKDFDNEIRVLTKAVKVFKKLNRPDAKKKLQDFQNRLEKVKELKGRNV